MSEAHAGMMVTPSIRLVRPLGEGGMGSVWVADHLALRTQVVVKFMASELQNSRDAIERFSREAAAAAQVKSPHVVQTLDHGVSSEGVPYIVMELLEGRDLGAHLEEHGKLAPELVVEILLQLARAIEKAHERGIVHRDIKPGNIFLCDAGSGEVFVKLLDFGIAKGVDVPKLDSHTKTGSMVGSPFYMSPEQILGSKDIDHRSDLWSMGVVAFEALTGVRPFDAETMGGLAIKIHSEALPSVKRLAPHVPEAVDAWFARACARSVEERYRSARELAEGLAAALGGQLPRSLDMPRISSSGSGSRAPVSGPLAIAPTLATTDAGLERPLAPSRARGRLVGIAFVGLLGAVGSFFAARALREGARPPQGLVADPGPTRTSLATSGATPSATPTPAVVASAAPSASSLVLTAAPASVTPPTVPVTAPVPVTSPRPTTRPRPGAGVVTTPASQPSAAPQLPAPRPTSSGHDIF